MISQLQISGFRCLEQFELQPDKINIFVGRNNSGKSSVLEAVTIGASSTTGYRDAIGDDILMRLANRRNWALEYFVRLGADSSNILVRRGDESSTEQVEINLSYLVGAKSGSLSDATLTVMRSRATELAHRYPPRYLVERRQPLPERRDVDAASLATAVAQEEAFQMDRLLEEPKLLVRFGTREDVLFQFDRQLVRSSPTISAWPEESNILFTGVRSENDLKQLYDRLLPTARFATVMEQVKEGIDYLTDLRTLQDDIFVYQRALDRPIPISLMGDGFRDVLRIAFMAALTRNGIAVFEEPENSLHPGFLGLATDYLSRAATKGSTQLFISTHSLEFVQYMLERAPDITKIIRMSQTDNEISYEILTGKEALEESKEIGTDLRGV
jgi:hypothetical protein